MTTLEVLKGVRELLADEDRWCKRVMARGKQYPVDPRSRHARQWCLLGAAERVGHFAFIPPPMGRLLNAACGRPPVVFNDDPSTTHADILRVLDQAIAQEGE